MTKSGFIACIVVVAGALTIPLVTISNFASGELVVASRAAMAALYPVSMLICGGALLLMISGSAPRFAAPALALHTASWFIAFDIGKLGHDAEMRRFFEASQLPVW